MTRPFQYPSTPHVFRHGPKGYADYSSFRPWLRDEFSFCCVYCRRREAWLRSQSEFDLDHFSATAHRADAEPASEFSTVYEELRYSCTVCNALKSDSCVPDPLTAFLVDSVEVASDGVMQARTSDAEKLIHELGLNSSDMVEYRQTWIEIIALAELHDPDLFRRLMGYPRNLPDLKRLRPPGGNTRPEGTAQSYFERRQRGELPETY